jgi:hypothetical protein
MVALRSVETEETLETEQVVSEEQQVINLIATLVRAHYLEKSTQFHDAMDFEKLFKLDTLEQLKHLEELKKLGALDQLKAMDNLKELSHLDKLSALSHLSELKPLSHLEKLDELKELNKLERLNSLHELDSLRSLEQLQAMENLKELRELNKLSELSHLSELKPLIHLDKLEELKELNKLERLNSLNQLDKLSELKSLDNLKSLKELDKLKAIQTLGHLLEHHQSTLTPLVHLDKLRELIKLNDLEKLSQLSNLNKLEELNKLDKLDKIDDAHFAERLKQLDKLDILKNGTKKLVAQQFLSFGLELIKLSLAGFVIVFLLSRETGREIVVKTLPALGFGSGAQVNLGLKLLVGETAPEAFQAVVADVRKRIDAEIEMAFSFSGMLSINRRLEIINQIQSYSFQGAGVDLAEEVKKKMNSKLTKLHEIAASRIEFDMSFARNKQDKVAEDNLREMKLLLVQKQYPTLLEKTLPHWGSSEAITMAAIVGTISMKLTDPVTLEELLQKEMPGRGAY